MRKRHKLLWIGLMVYALTQSLQKLTSLDSFVSWYGFNWLVFLTILTRFYFGQYKHLSFEGRLTKHADFSIGAMIKFGLLYAQAIVLNIMALRIDNSQIFVALVMALLFLNALWLLILRGTYTFKLESSLNLDPYRNSSGVWCFNNLITVFFMGVVCYQFACQVPNWMAVLALMNSGVDIGLTLRFYSS